ncbi:MAG TPA: LURP-one-related family protein [Gemmatimonadaceae bacterium]|nr:LURP-one-related family protein [Gemmatimonadaceae bacterium]
MSRYVLKQKLFSFGDDFRIRDEQGKEVFFVDGKAFSIGSKLSFQDLAGNELAFIKQKILNWSPTFEIWRDGALAAVVKKKLFALFHHRFSVDVPGPDDLEAEGDFLDHEYSFRRGGRTVATVSKKWFALGDTYGVDVADGEDDILILASAVVIDQACHPDDGKRH